MYANGRDVVKNERIAVEWWQKAADQGHALAQFALGIVYAKGIGVVENIETAIEWWQKAAEQGQENAQEILTSIGLSWF